LTVPEAPDERDLVARCNKGEEVAWAALYERYRDRVYRITHWRRWRLPPEEADEVMQEVFLALVSSLRSFDFRSSLETYISHVATNKCISALRKRLAARAGGQTGHRPLEEIEGFLGDDGDPPDRQLLDREQQEILQQGLRRLGQACRSDFDSSMAFPIRRSPRCWTLRRAQSLPGFRAAWPNFGKCAGEFRAWNGRSRLAPRLHHKG
jgi:RNA polymerase sigma factor (sigma-70 family)